MGGAVVLLFGQLGGSPAVPAGVGAYFAPAYYPVRYYPVRYYPHGAGVVPPVPVPTPALGPPVGVWEQLARGRRWEQPARSRVWEQTHR